MTPRSTPALAAIIGLLVAGCMTTEYHSRRGSYRLKRRLNTWETTVGLPVDEVHEAVLAGLRDLQLSPFTNRVDRLSGLVDGHLADGTDFEINLEATSPSATRIAVRVGLHGDKIRSLRLFRAAEEHF